MITIKDLEGLKLVQDDNFGEEVTTLGALEHAITQGSQGWGVSPSVAVQLHLARELKSALAAVRDSDDLHNQLKSKQLELGRTKKALEAAKKKLDKLSKAD